MYMDVYGCISMYRYVSIKFLYFGGIFLKYCKSIVVIFFISEMREQLMKKPQAEEILNLLLFGVKGYFPLFCLAGTVVFSFFQLFFG